PEGFLGRAQTAGAVVGGRLLSHFQRALVRAAAFLVPAEILAPFLDDGLKQFAGVYIAVLADAEKQNAIQDALDGLVEVVAFEQFGMVVVLVKIGGEFLAGFVEEFKEV